MSTIGKVNVEALLAVLAVDSVLAVASLPADWFTSLLELGDVLEPLEHPARLRTVRPAATAMVTFRVDRGFLLWVRGERALSLTTRGPESVNHV